MSTSDVFFFFSSRRRHTRCGRDWSSDVCSSDLGLGVWGVSAAIASSSLETYLNGNFTSLSTTNAFTKAGFRGPYIASLDSDPWGNRYILTASYLAGTTNHAYVISAGPNGVMDTAPNQTGVQPFAVGLDDIVSVIR